MTLYSEDSYIFEIETYINEILDNNIIGVKDVIAYEGGGGQEEDEGLINNSIFFKATRIDKKPYLKLKENPYKIGDKIKISIDKAKRLKNMNLHTTQHILSALLYKKFKINTISISMKDLLYIQTDAKEFTLDQVFKLEEEFTRVVEDDLKIKSYLVDDVKDLNLRREAKVKEDIRIVEITDLDKIACKGTHLSSTRFSGPIFTYKSQNIKGQVKLCFYVGDDAALAIHTLRKNSLYIQDILSSSLDNQYVALEKLYNDYLDTKYKLDKMQMNYIRELLKDGIFISDVSGLDLDFNLVIKVINEMEDGFFALVKKGEFLIYNKENKKNIFDILTQVKAKGNLKGPLFRGIIEDSAKLIKEIKNQYDKLV